MITHDVIIYENEFNSASNASEAVREQLTGEKPTKVRSTFVDDDYEPPLPFLHPNENANIADEPIAPINDQSEVSRDQHMAPRSQSQPVTSRSQSHHLHDQARVSYKGMEAQTFVAQCDNPFLRNYKEAM